MGNQDPNVNAKLTVQARPHVSEQVGMAKYLQSPATTATLQGGARKKRNDLVREIMKKHKLSLPAASKYMKQQNSIKFMFSKGRFKHIIVLFFNRVKFLVIII